MMYAIESFGYLLAGVLLGVPLGEVLRPFVVKMRHR